MSYLVFGMVYLLWLILSIFAFNMEFKVHDYFSSGTPTMFVDMLAQVFSNFN